MRERDVDMLMLAVARDRNHEAFEDLVSHMGRSAHGLAYRITGQSDLAEEAVQEALLGLWQKAPRMAH